MWWGHHGVELMACDSVPYGDLNWLREGYPEGIPPTDYLPVLVLLPRHIESVSEYDPRNDLRNRDSAAVKAALAVGCQVCEAGPGEDCRNLTNDFGLPRQRIVHFCRVPGSRRRRDLVIAN